MVPPWPCHTTILCILYLYWLHAGTADHWVCIQFGNLKVHVMDSLGLPLADDLILQIASVYKCDGTTLTIQSTKVQQQSGANDCGLFAIAFAVEYCYGVSAITTGTDYTGFDQSLMRKHLYTCLNNGIIKLFPKSSKKITSLTRNTTARIPLYCYCRMPECFDDMVECDGCHTWLHLKCVGHDSVRSVPKVFVCDTCQDRG